MLEKMIYIVQRANESILCNRACPDDDLPRLIVLYLFYILQNFFNGYLLWFSCHKTIIEASFDDAWKFLDLIWISGDASLEPLIINELMHPVLRSFILSDIILMTHFGMDVIFQEMLS